MFLNKSAPTDPAPLNVFSIMLPNVQRNFPLNWLLMLQFFIAQSLASTLIGNQLSMIVQRSLFIGKIKLKFNHRKITPHSVIKKNFFFVFGEAVIFGRQTAHLWVIVITEYRHFFSLATTGCVSVMKFLQRVSLSRK